MIYDCNVIKMMLTSYGDSHLSRFTLLPAVDKCNYKCKFIKKIGKQMSIVKYLYLTILTASEMGIKRKRK